MKRMHEIPTVTPSDRGGESVILPIFAYARENTDFRRVLYTGEHMQLAEMCIPGGGHVGGEIHEESDQMLLVTDGVADVYVGTSADDAVRIGTARAGDSVLIAAGAFHDLLSVGRAPLRLLTVYAPPMHPFGTVQNQKGDQA